MCTQSIIRIHLFSGYFHSKCNFLRSFFYGHIYALTNEQLGITYFNPNGWVSAQINPPWVDIKWWPSPKELKYFIARYLAYIQFYPFGALYYMELIIFFCYYGNES